MSFSSQHVQQSYSTQKSSPEKSLILNPNHNHLTMQETHLMSTERVFTGGGGGADRRLCQNQTLKCPRCDSLNTKFCYYNNYNHSQPRHFCKSCRRYWTEGGVLRNVAVGGGCRKSSKRYSSKSSKPSEEFKPTLNDSNSSSECSTLTATQNSAAAVVTTPPSADAVPISFDAVLGFGDSKFSFPQIRNPNFSSELMTGADGSGGGGFVEIGNFSTLMTSLSNNDPTTHVCNINQSYDAVSPFRKSRQDENCQLEQWQLNSEAANVTGGYINPTVQIDQSSNLQSESLSWEQQQQMFELTSAADHGYWSQQQWSNDDDHRYLPY